MQPALLTSVMNTCRSLLRHVRVPQLSEHRVQQRAGLCSPPSNPGPQPKRLRCQGVMLPKAYAPLCSRGESTLHFDHAGPRLTSIMYRDMYPNSSWACLQSWIAAVKVLPDSNACLHLVEVW